MIRLLRSTASRNSLMRNANISFLSSGSTSLPALHSQSQRRHIRVVPIGKIKHRQPSRFNNSPNIPLRGSAPAAAYQRRILADTLPLRTGVLAVKTGMTALFVTSNETLTDEDAASSSSGAAMNFHQPGIRRLPATILQMDRVQVIGHKTREMHGYYAVVVGEGWRKPSRLNKAMLGSFARIRGNQLALTKHEDETTTAGSNNPVNKNHDGSRRESTHIGVSPKREIREFKVRDAGGLLPIGSFISPSWFRPGQFVDARGTARGMGFAGGMKRHGFKGQPASHGVSLTHRSMGSAGGGQGSGSRVHPGKRMPGRMGGQRHTVQCLKVLMVDPENGLVVINGAVSGRKGDLVMLSDSIKKPWPIA